MSKILEILRDIRSGALSLSDLPDFLLFLVFRANTYLNDY
jgi:hypothetical protein